MGDCKLPKDGENPDGWFSGVGAVAGISAFWLGCVAFRAAKIEPGTGNWFAAAFGDPEIVLALFTENGEKGCPKLGAVAGSLVLTAVSWGLMPWNSDGAAGVFVGPKELAPENIEDAKGFLGSVNDAGGELMGLNNVEGAVVTAAGVSVF